MVVNESYPGTLHHFADRLVAFEWSSPVAKPNDADKLSTIIFVGGLFDDLLTVPFAPLIAANLPGHWRFVQARLTSSSFGWGIGGLDQDVKDISACIAYFRHIRPQGKIILLGHSTGSQDVMHYAVSPLAAGEKPRPKVDGYILQAGISDREAVMLPPEENVKTVELAKQYVERGDGDDVLPKKSLGFLWPCTANRFLSLISPGPEHAGEDDMFSSDLKDERLRGSFGKLGETKIPIQILYSGSDQHVPASIDKEALIARWHRVIREHGGTIHEQSGIVPGMDHNGENSSEEVMMRLVKRVVAFAESL